MELGNFENLTPDIMIGAVEDALKLNLTGLAAPLPSYINRVYEFEAVNGIRYIAKFYRPGRWSREALEDEHDFVIACSQADIPVIAPIELSNKSTLGSAGNIFFAVYPKRFGREIELNDDESWSRIGSLVARMHNVGDDKDAEYRIMHHPLESTGDDITRLLDGNYIPTTYRSEFENTTTELMELIVPMFDDIEYIRIHGDCHRANVLERPGEGLMLIDFDDMMIGPPVQDIWLLLPEHAADCPHEIEMILQGYTMLRDFDRNTLRLIEPLRAMRMLYFLAWIGRQIHDFQFESHFPGWGTDAFWRREIADLKNQYGLIYHSS